jgi:hypothetical protein
MLPLLFTVTLVGIPDLLDLAGFAVSPAASLIFLERISKTSLRPSAVFAV